MPRVAVVPPCGLTTVACPSVRPLQVILVPVVGAAVIGAGSVIVTEGVVKVHQLSSLITHS